MLEPLYQAVFSIASSEALAACCLGSTHGGESTWDLSTARGRGSWEIGWDSVGAVWCGGVIAPTPPPPPPPNHPFHPTAWPDAGFYSGGLLRALTGTLSLSMAVSCCCRWCPPLLPSQPLPSPPPRLLPLWLRSLQALPAPPEQTHAPPRRCPPPPTPPTHPPPSHTHRSTRSASGCASSRAF